MKRVRRWTMGLVLLCGIVGLAGVYRAGSLLIAPAPSTVDPVPDDLPLAEVRFDSRSDSTLSGWLISSSSSCAAVVLMHGIRANRRSMLGRARFLFEAGYDVLLFDFQAHGESSGEQITFGYLEKLDAEAAVAYMKAVRPNARVAVIGTSLGGVAAILSAPNLDADAVIVEAVYPTIERAAQNRLSLQFGVLAELLAPALLIQMNARLGFGPEELRPIDHIASLGAPVFVIAGSDDQRTLAAESRALFGQARDPKEFWLIEGAGHTDFHRYAGADYVTRALSFLRQHLACSSD